MKLDSIAGTTSFEEFSEGQIDGRNFNKDLEWRLR